ncbi:patatin [Enterococcus saigonensis]|uniref:Patatin n=1 Tax=Enterococcus saigonensis TaxID=1805431 RepID=A0A679IJG5_9ENTE|nr:patatin-like phospholipase family protein [Enterococcus saigonensis]BCA84701.1 patatin [Enterococcus saigonensis]
MQTTKLYPSDFTDYKLVFKRSCQGLPFFASNSAAKEDMRQKIKEQKGWQITKHNLTIFLAGKVAADNFFDLDNFLWDSEETSSRQQLLQLLDNFCREKFFSGLRFEVATKELTTENLNWLLDNGFQVNQSLFSRKCQYQSALVLVGGGARGAYQIGVWQALQELDIPFSIVTGTSVGALNGGLILLADLKAASQLWESLSTDQVLQFPAAAADNHALNLLLRQIRSLTYTALRENGASTEPLNHLIQRTFDEEKMLQSQKDLYICTTRLPDFSEKVYHFQKEQLTTALHWLSASASFYPAMKATEIAGDYYIDGGYRNNVPVDVAVEQGATECIIVDVKGPGFTKKYRPPQNVATISLSSPWTLGSFLVFDPQRSKRNLRLGYLETLKYFQRYTGFWYTFAKEEFNKLWWEFCRRLRKKQDPLWQIIKAPYFWRKLETVYGKKVAFETAGLSLAELSGVWLNILPDEIYQEKTFIAQVKRVSTNQIGEFDAALSVSEWLHLYRERLVAWSDSRLFLSFLQLQGFPFNLPQILLENLAVSIVTAEFCKYLFKGDQEE